MKTEIMEIWTAALESGEYKKTKGQLKKGQKSFCCLGVLCDLYHKETGTGNWIYARGDEPHFDDGVSDGSSGILPMAVKEWAGMYSREGAPRYGALANVTSIAHYSLPDINDNTKLSFKGIAKIIRENVNRL